MKVYATFNADGTASAFYNDDVYPDEYEGMRNAGIPAAAVQLTQALYEELTNTPWSKRWDGRKVVDYTPPAAPDPVPAVPPDAPKVPTFLTRRQFMLELYRVGLLDKVTAFINASSYPPVKIEFDNSTTFARGSTTLQVFATDPAIGLSDAQIDALFIDGAKL